MEANNYIVILSLFISKLFLISLIFDQTFYYFIYQVKFKQI